MENNNLSNVISRPKWISRCSYRIAEVLYLARIAFLSQRFRLRCGKSKIDCAFKRICLAVAFQFKLAINSGIGYGKSMAHTHTHTNACVITNSYCEKGKLPTNQIENALDAKTALMKFSLGFAVFPQCFTHNE